MKVCHILYHIILYTLTYHIELPEGEKLDLQELQALANTANGTNDIPKMEMERMMDLLRSARSLKAKGLRSVGRSHSQDVAHTAQRLHTEVSDLNFALDIV